MKRAVRHKFAMWNLREDGPGTIWRPCRLPLLLALLSQPTAEIMDLLVLLHGGQYPANIVRFYDEGIAVQHGTHAVDQMTGSTRAHGEQFCDLPPVDELDRKSTV